MPTATSYNCLDSRRCKFAVDRTVLLSKVPRKQHLESEDIRVDRRDFVFKTLFVAGAACLGAGCGSTQTQGPSTLSSIGVRLVKDLAADPGGDLQARNVVSALAEAYPRRLYQVLLAVEELAHERHGRGFADLDESSRHRIIADIYAGEGAIKQFCALAVGTYYNYPYRWKIVGYRPVPHEEYSIEDPEFDTYYLPPPLMEV